MTAPKVFIEVHTDLHGGYESSFQTTTYYLLKGIHNRDSLSVQVDDFSDEVVVSVDAGYGGGTLVLHRREFKAFVKLLNDIFIEGLEVTDEDAAEYL